MHNLIGGEVVLQLKKALESEWTKNKKICDKKETVLQCQIDVPFFPTLQLLGSYEIYPKVFWKDRDGLEEIVGIGSADTISTYQTNSLSVLPQLTQKIINQSEGSRYFGGFSFQDEKNKEQLWKQWPKSLFFLPRFEWRKSSKGSTLVYRTVVEPNKSLPNLYDELELQCYELCLGEVAAFPPPSVEEKKLEPCELKWKKLFFKAQKRIRNGDLKKIVLARHFQMVFDQKINPFSFLEKTAKQLKETYAFALQLSESECFISVTPERLYKRTWRLLETEALAGTRLKSKSLDWNEKELNEHTCVAQEIYARLNHLVALKLGDQFRTKSFASLEHLHQNFKGKLKPYISDEEILKELHPTSAVGGLPRKQALEFISKEEPFDRGWYAAPFGVISKNQSEFCVSIRSALIQENRVNLFSGAGITEKSDERMEWNELDEKLQHYLLQVDSNKNTF